jgi:phosphate:Na+ symporter
MFNVMGTALFTALIWIFKQPTVDLLLSLVPGDDVLALQMRVSIFHVVFNVSTTFLLLPFVKQLVKLSQMVIKEKEESTGAEAATLKFADDRLLTMPSVALMQVKKDTFYMADLAMETLQIAFNGFISRELDVIDGVLATNEKIAQIGESISNYLVKVSARGTTLSEERLCSALHSHVGDIARVSELAENLTKYTKREVRDNLYFSEGINEKLVQMHELLKKQYEVVRSIVLDGKHELVATSDNIEEQVDEMRRDLVAEHILRLGQGKCRPENNTIFINLVSNLERVGDHLNFIVHDSVDSK